MITTNTPRRIDGRDIHDDRWAAHVCPSDPGIVIVRTIDGVAHLELADIASIAQWLTDHLEAETAP